MSEQAIIPARATRVLETSKKMGQLAKKEISDGIQAKQAGKPVTWMGLSGILEPLRAFDIVQQFPENYGTATAAAGSAPACIEYTTNYGFPRDLCSYFTINFGYVMGAKDRSDLKFPGGGLSMPDFLVIDTTNCIHRTGWWRTINEILKVPFFVVDSPWLSQRTSIDNIDEHFVEYLAPQIRELISFLEDVTKQKFEEDSLKQAMVWSRQGQELAWEIVQLQCKTVPCPAGADDYVYLLYAINCLAGTRLGADMLREARDEIKVRIERKESVVPEEKYRLLFMGNPSYFALGIYSYVHKYGAVFVADPVLFNAFCNPFSPLDLEHPYESLAKEYMGKWLNFSYDKCTKWQDFYIAESKADGIVYCGQKGCKASSGSLLFLRDRAEEQGLPTLWLEMEQADPEGYDPVRVASQMDAFMEVVTERRRSRS
jgi:benzoyl-CoA reductase subunit B